MDAHEAISETLIPARLFVVGGAGATEVDGVQLKDLPDFPEDYKPEATTMAEIFGTVPLRVRPGVDHAGSRAADRAGERTGSYKLGADSPAGESISTQDFAVAVLDELENPQHENRRFTVANLGTPRGAGAPALFSAGALASPTSGTGGARRAV